METDKISCTKLQNGETVSLGCIEIVSVPHVSIIGEEKDTQEILENYKTEYSKLLNEVYQIYKASGGLKDISLEFLWTTSPVTNQPFKASIRLFLIVRSISRRENEAIHNVQSTLNLFRATLSMQKYELKELDYSQLAKAVFAVNDSRVCAIIKEESTANLQSPIFPYCYTFSRFPAANSDMSHLIGALIDCPNCAVSFQLIPTTYSPEEATELDRTAQALDTLRRGVMDQGLGSISFTLADRHAETYKYYSDHKFSSLFSYNILIYGNPGGAESISGKLFGQLSASKESNAELKILDLVPANVQKDSNFFPLPWAVEEYIINCGRNELLWSSGSFSPALYRLPHIITGEEASEFFRLPIGSSRVSAGLNINEAKKSAKTYTDNIINAGDITVGIMRSSSNGDSIGFSLKDLAKHMLVVGTPGSGKTTFSVSLLDRLWKDHGIPFLVIEPAKNEYRALVQSIPDLQIFTPGKNFISPFVFNPFVPPKNVTLETYKSTLKTAFSAAVSMSTPLDKIFEEAVNNCFSDFHWLDTYTSDDSGNIFNISDFIKCFQKTFDDIGYTGDARNIGRAGVVRLKSLVNLFDNYYSIPIEELMKKPTVIELNAIENADQKALIIALLLLSILAYVNANYVGDGRLRNVILLEEAHVLLDASSSGQGDANPSAIAQGLLKRMLAEIRSYGVGIVVADQSPRKVGTDVVALTDMKVVFRLVEREDKQIIADSTNMSETQIQRMSKLRPGEAYLFFNKLDEPEEVITPDYRLENNISISLSDQSIRELSTYWRGREAMLRPYPQCALCSGCQASCDYKRRILAREIARRLFNKYFSANMKDFDMVYKVFGQISRLTRQELNGEEFSPELLSCVKVHLWRQLRYGTKIPISDKLIENSIMK